MVQIPAFCDTCGAAFSSGFAVENSRNITFSGNKSGPCPRCGGVGSVIDGVFNVVDDVIEILSAPETTKEALNKLTGILKQAAENKDTPEVISEKIETEIPELSGVTKFIPKNTMELIAWLTVILLAIQTIGQLTKDDKPNTTIILNQSIEQSMKPENYYPFKPSLPPNRTSPCLCGSGKRYKHCCGKPI